jgi:molecular chaperone HtpG
VTKSDLISNPGTIARSGTRQFMEAVQQSAHIRLMGHFGVGFSVAFLVVATLHHNNDDQSLWKSEAGQNFSIRATRPVRI